MRFRNRPSQSGRERTGGTAHACACLAQPPLRERFVLDEADIRRALELAERGRGYASPNPLVGAVVVAPDGSTLGEGWHEGPGTAHAEAMALVEAGERARGATLYCTLEPCDHFGRTPPCTQSIIDAGIARAVIASGDPNPIVDGRGAEHLRRAGVEVVEGVLEAEAVRQNEAYMKHITTGIPFVTLKLAATLDGRIAGADGSSTWITGEESRAQVHRMRAASDAILVGAGTALADDPLLTARDPEYRGRPPVRVVVDATGRVPASQRLLDDDAPTLGAPPEESSGDARDAWSAAGAEVVVCEHDGRGVALGELLEALGKRDIQSLLVEGGSQISGSFVGSGLVDKVVIFTAAKILGGSEAPMLIGETGITTLSEAIDMDISDVARVGEDMRVEAYVHRNS